MKHVKMLALFA